MTQTRRRGAELEQAILDAAWAELSEVGYASLTMERVAARAGTSKPVVYRRWANRAELVLAAWSSQVPIESATPDTDSLRSDLHALFTRIARRMEGMMSEMIAGVMGEAFRHPEVAGLLRDRLGSSPLATAVWTIVDRAIDRGELPPVLLPPRVLRLPLDLVRGEAVINNTPVSEKTIDEFVDDVYLPLLRGLAAD